MRSIGTSRYTTAAAFAAASMIIGSDREDTPVTDVQEAWLSEVYGSCSGELERIPEIASNATREVQNHIDFLKKHGWEAQVTNCPPNGFLTAAVLDVLVHWSTPGKQTKLKVDGVGEFPAARLTKGVELRRHKQSGTVVAILSTKSGDQVLLAMADRAPSDVIELNRVTDELFHGECEAHYGNEGLIFPMVDLVSKQELDWLVGLLTRARGSVDAYAVVKAVQQATLKMNHEGARARSADEMGFELCSMPPPPFKIDRPFLVAFQRPNLTQNLYAAFVDHDSWKDPGGLGT
jgi:hypothetical protein